MKTNGRRPDEKTLALYGLTNQTWTVIFQHQKGRCGICGATHPGRGSVWHTDHDHAYEQWTGGKIRVRGILCPKCNTYLTDDRDVLEWPEVLQTAVEDYLMLNPAVEALEGYVPDRLPVTQPLPEPSPYIANDSPIIPEPSPYIANDNQIKKTVIVKSNYAVNKGDLAGIRPLVDILLDVQDSVGGYVQQHPELGIHQQSGRLMILSNDDPLRPPLPLPRTEAVKLIDACTDFVSIKRGNWVGDKLTRIAPPSDVVSYFMRAAPDSIPEVPEAAQKRLNDMWVAFLAGWWAAHASNRVSVSMLAHKPGIDTIKMMLPPNYPANVSTGHIISERAGWPVEIAAADAQVVAPHPIGKARNGARLYILEPAPAR